MKCYDVSTTECLEKRFCTIKRVTGQLGPVFRTMSVFLSVVEVLVVVVVDKLAI